MYTYLLGWSSHKKYYYGVRYAKKCDVSDLMRTYFTSSKYVKDFIKLYGMPDIVQIRKTFKTKEEAMLWEHKVLRRMHVVANEKWINKTDNIAIDYHGMKHNTIPGMLASKEKLSGKSYEELYGVEKALELKKQRSEKSKTNWLNSELREKMKIKPKDTSAYREAALKRWANKELRAKMCESMKVPKKLKEV